MDFFPLWLIQPIERLESSSSYLLLALALAVLLLFYIVGYVLKRALLRLLPRAKASDAWWDEAIIEALIPPVRYGVRFIGLAIALKIIGFVVAQDFINSVLNYSGNIFLFLIGWFCWRSIQQAEENIVKRRLNNTPAARRETTSIAAIAKLLRLVLVVIIILMALQQLGANVSSLVAAGGIGGIAVGFAAKDLLANFFGGLLLYMERPFQVGDWIRAPSQDIEGTVEDIGMRMTRLRTFEQRPLYVPNSLFTSVPVENATRMSNYKINLTIGVRYQDATSVIPIVDQVRKNLIDMREIDKKRTLVVNFNEFAPSSLDFLVYCFALTTDYAEYHKIKEQVLVMIMQVVESHDASIAYPTSTVYLQPNNP